MTQSVFTTPIAYCEYYMTLIVGACTFPSNLIGQWDDNVKGTLTFTSTTFQSWTVSDQGSFVFTCFMNVGNIYISKYVCVCARAPRVKCTFFKWLVNKLVNMYSCYLSDTNMHVHTDYMIVYARSRTHTHTDTHIQANTNAAFSLFSDRFLLSFIVVRLSNLPTHIGFHILSFYLWISFRINAIYYITLQI